MCSFQADCRTIAAAGRRRVGSASNPQTTYGGGLNGFNSNPGDSLLKGEPRDAEGHDLQHELQQLLGVVELKVCQSAAG